MTLNRIRNKNIHVRIKGNFYTEKTKEDSKALPFVVLVLKRQELPIAPMLASNWGPFSCLSLPRLAPPLTAGFVFLQKLSAYILKRKMKVISNPGGSSTQDLF